MTQKKHIFVQIRRDIIKITHPKQQDEFTFRVVYVYFTYTRYNAHKYWHELNFKIC